MRSAAVSVEATATIFTSSGIDMERAFRGFDENHDGKIDYGEFARGLKALGAELDQQQLEDLITILDRDGDGVISDEEIAMEDHRQYSS